MKASIGAGLRRKELFGLFLLSLRCFAVQDSRKIVSAIAIAVRAERPVVLMMGAHSIKLSLRELDKRD